MTQPGADPLARTLPAERTVLAWTRTSFAFLVNGVLLSIKDFRGHHGPAAFIPAALAVAVALGTYLIVYIIGISSIVLIAATTIAQLL